MHIEYNLHNCVVSVHIMLYINEEAIIMYMYTYFAWSKRISFGKNTLHFFHFR